MSSVVTPAEGSAEITLRGLVGARWVLIALAFLATLLMAIEPAWVAPILAFVPTRAVLVGFVLVLVVWTVSNLVDVVRIRRGRATQASAGIHLLVDATALTALLGMAGGATNPFTTLYFVPITLATQVSPRWTWSLAGSSLAGFAMLFLLHPLPEGPPGHEHHFAGHLRGMWLAFGASGLLITSFVHRIALRLRKERAELTRLREQALEDRHLASIGSLAAGAAHELGTPLGTIAVLAAELPHMVGAEREAALASIRQEVTRCKTIVQRMATPDARVTALASADREWPLAALVRDLETRGVPLRVEITPTARAATCEQPRETLATIVRELVHNAAVACRNRPDSRGIEIEIDTDGETARVRVRDDGVGMSSALASAAFDPFVSTKAEGEGMGLGLYLARAQLRRLGGGIRLQSTPGRGTEVEVVVPMRRDA